MLLALGEPTWVRMSGGGEARYWSNEWFADADHWLCDQGIATPGQRRTIINDYVTWLRNRRAEA